MESNSGDPGPLETMATLNTVEEVARGVFRHRYVAPAIADGAEPGQFVQIEVSHLAFPVTRRPFTVSRVMEEEGAFEIVFEVVGRGTAILASSIPGRSLSVMGPLGRGYRTAEGSWALIGGGMGAAGFPFLSERVDVRLAILGARSTEQLLPCEAGELLIATEDGSRGRCGLVTDLVFEACLDRYDHLALCGPLPMMHAVVEFLTEDVLERTQVSAESRMACGWGVCEGCVIPCVDGYRKCCTDGPVFPASDIDWAGWMELCG
ncbi:hypothetical protein GF402_07150 [Candidatus Fermentibacteria bacterium]|nr:hypothetical protein [Candidatus Fermentibacteria bacterium]